MERSSYGYEIERTIERIGNAYMLIYERLKPVPEAPFQAVESKAEAKTPAAAAAPAAGAPGTAGAGAAVQYSDGLAAPGDASGVPADYLARKVVDLIPDQIQEQVHKDNLQFTRDRQLLTKDYYHFLANVVRVCKFPPVTDYEVKESKQAADPAFKIIQFATRFALETLARAGENDVLPK